MKVPDAGILQHLFGLANCPHDARSRSAIVVRITDSRYLKPMDKPSGRACTAERNETTNPPAISNDAVAA
jgi:hypothetical protein